MRSSNNSMAVGTPMVAMLMYEGKVLGVLLLIHW